MEKDILAEWPSFGIVPYIGKYFRLHHGISNKQFADIPFPAVISLLRVLGEIETNSLDYADFKRKAQAEIEKWNDTIPKEFEIPKNLIKASLDRYYWGKTGPSAALGLKIKVDRMLFSDFLENQSSRRKDLWKTFGYIYSCRNFFTQRSIEEGKQNFEKKMERYVKNIKIKSGVYIQQIVSSLEMLEKITDNAISEIYRTVIRKSKKDKKEPAYMLYTLIYLNEFRFKCSTLKSLTEIGDFPACFSEMRRIIEGLTTHMFWDQLMLNLLKTEQRAKDVDLMRLFNEGTFKAAKERNLNIKEVSNKKQILANESLKIILNESSLTPDKTRKFVKKMHENMSIASYALIYGKFMSTSEFSGWNEKQIEKSELMIIDPKYDLDSLEIGIREVIDALTSSGIIQTESSNDIHDNLFTSLRKEKIILMPPSPTLPLRIIGYSILSEKPLSELKDMYNEFSPFTHSTWESNTVWPYTSVLEIMTFAENLKRFAQSLDDTINDFIDFFKPMVDIFLI